MYQNSLEHPTGYLVRKDTLGLNNLVDSDDLEFSVLYFRLSLSSSTVDKCSSHIYFALNHIISVCLASLNLQCGIGIATRGI
jgi:hypothetical protein